MANQIKNSGSTEVSTGFSWHLLYKIAALSAGIMVLMIPVQIMVYSFWGIPETALETFQLFEQNPLAGLLALELPYLISNLLSVPLFLAFYFSLRRLKSSRLRSFVVPMRTMRKLSMMNLIM